MELRYAVIDSPEGPLVAAATEKGLRLLEFLEPGEAPEARVRAKYPDATLAHAPRGFSLLRRELARYFRGEPVRFSVPLDLAGTELQRAVWAAMAEVPPGRTCSYTELAARVGRPDAVRAVAGAVAANHVAILLPCHRFVRKGGALGGFRWGPRRKEKLLAREGAGAGSG